MCGSAAPASRRERSSRLSTRRERRRVSSWITAAMSSRSSGESDGRADRLAGRRDRGQRRAQVVGDGPQQRRLDVSARRRAAVSTTPPSSPRAPARRSAAPRAPARRAPAACAGSPRRCRRRRAACPGACVPSRSGKATVRSSPSTASISIAAECSSSACASRAAAVGRLSARLLPRSSSRAISAARSASRRRSCASRVRARATSATELAIRATTKKAIRATQLRESLIVNSPVGGRWKKLNARRAEHRRGDPQPGAPGDRDDEHRRQVDDAQRRDRRDVPQRIDDQRAQRDGARARRPRPRGVRAGLASRNPNESTRLPTAGMTNGQLSA